MERDLNMVEYDPQQSLLIEGNHWRTKCRAESFGHGQRLYVKVEKPGYGEVCFTVNVPPAYYREHPTAHYDRVLALIKEAFEATPSKVMDDQFNILGHEINFS
jgi:hypothetical protein